MAPVVVYDGNNAGKVGTLFEDMRFFVAQRVPTRSRWLDLIRANGGTVVPLEKDADYVICDHARKYNPPGSISWTFIQDSLKNGELEDPDYHPAGPPEGTVRHARSSQPSKGTRKPFTATDDRIFREWVRLAERQGLSTKGNNIYQQLELEHPNHTWQSWRDHWVKKLSHLSQLPESEDDLPDDGPRRVKPALRNSITRKTPITQTPSVDEIKSVGPSKSVPFSREEIEELYQLYSDIVAVDEGKTTQAWEEWAKQHPIHTAEEWQTYFRENIMPYPRKVDDSESAREQTGEPEETVPLDVSQQTPSTPHMQTRSQSHGTNKLVDTSLSNEDVFKIELSDFAQNMDFEVDFNPNICGRDIPLFRIWQVVRSEFGGFDSVEKKNLWSNVCKYLNFHQWRGSDAPDLLRNCYIQNLVDFEDAKLQYLESHVEMQSESAEDDNNDDEDDNLDIPTPKTNKRRLSTDDGANKRQRISNGKGKEREIPSTPVRFEDSVTLVHFEDEEHDLFNDPKEQRTVHMPIANVSKTKDPETQGFSFQASDPFISSGGSAPESENDSQQQAVELEDYIYHFISLGYSQEIVIKALEATTMETGDAGVVMEALTNGEGIPQNMQGVWTEEDDEALDAPEDSDDFQKVLQKHGSEIVSIRQQYMNEKREVQKQIELG